MNKRTLPALLFAAIGLAACKDSTGGNTNQNITQLILEPSTYYLGVGDTTTLTAVGVPEDDPEQFVVVDASFKSTNTSVATVNSSGKVTGVSIGTTQIIAKGSGYADTATVNVVTPGNFRTFNVEPNSICTNGKWHQARLVATTAHVMLYEDFQNPTGGFSDAQYQAIANEFEAVGYQTDVANFGQPTDRDGNGKVIGLFTRAVNELTPAGVGYVYGGFFYARDVFPRVPEGNLGACPTSNKSEMFYLLAPDPNGTINGNRRSAEYVRTNTLSTLPHEMQHLINASRRYAQPGDVPPETVWLDEGLSHVGEELAYYAKSGYGPGQNLNATAVFGTNAQAANFDEYQDNNLGRLITYLQAPNSNSPIADNDELETRGATWWLLRYLADRKGGSQAAFWQSLVATSDTGLVNLQKAVGSDVVAMARDWSVMTYTDDALTTSPQFQEASWNHRSITGALPAHTYPLRVQTLGNGNAAIPVMSFSAAYFKFGVAPAATADIRLSATGGTPPAACTNTALTVGQVQQVTLGTTGAGFCLSGGATGAEYVVIPFYGSTTQGATINLSVTATGVIAPVGPPSPVREAVVSSPFPLDGFDVGSMRGGAWELELRLRERRLGARSRGNRGVSGFGAARLASVEGPAGVTISVVRTR